MITLTAPIGAPFPDIINLPNPELGDSVTQNLKTKYGFAMSGKIITTISEQAQKKFQYNFAKLKRNDMDALVTFLFSHANADIQLTDYRGANWRVKLLTNPIEFTEGLSFYQCQLEFQGVAI